MEKRLVRFPEKARPDDAPAASASPACYIMLYAATLTDLPENAMPFSVHMDDATRRALESLARKSGKTRNALINEAVRDFVRSRGGREWPENVRAWLNAGSKRVVAAMPPFEFYRSELAEQGEPRL
jgi:predicted transcriptional regulator